MLMTSSLSFIDILETGLRENPPKLKRDRTRERLKLATAKMLEERGYHAMRVADVTECAGVAEGSFYVYFTDKKDVSLTVLTELLDVIAEISTPKKGASSPFEAIQATNRVWIALCRANSGLMRCVFQLGDEEPDFGRLVQRTNRQWYERVAVSVLRRHADFDRDSVLLVIYFLGAMMDEIVRKLIVYPDPEFHDVLRRLKADDDALADAASLIWLRVLRTEASIPEDLKPVAKKLVKLVHP